MTEQQFRVYYRRQQKRRNAYERACTASQAALTVYARQRRSRGS